MRPRSHPRSSTTSTPSPINSARATFPRTLSAAPSTAILRAIFRSSRHRFSCCGASARLKSTRCATPTITSAWPKTDYWRRSRMPDSCLTKRSPMPQRPRSRDSSRRLRLRRPLRRSSRATTSAGSIRPNSATRSPRPSVARWSPSWVSRRSRSGATCDPRANDSSKPSHTAPTPTAPTWSTLVSSRRTDSISRWAITDTRVA